jgi:protein gp37
MGKSSIEWTERTWNPVTGCTKISAGCKFCYAEELHTRYYEHWKSSGDPTVPKQFQVPFTQVVCHPDRLKQPLSRRDPTLYFVNSMSDMFHEHIPESFLKEVFGVMNKASRHTFQILTKRVGRLFELNYDLSWTPNIWMGVSIENRAQLDRKRTLDFCSAHIRFLSIEPLLEDLGAIDLGGIHWVIVGGESGTTPRPMQEEWVRNIKDQCVAHDVPFFYKQTGGWKGGNKEPFLDGRTWRQYPKVWKKPESVKETLTLF